MGYLTHQDRLLPVLANAYTLHLALGSLKVRAQSGELVRRPSLNLLECPLKAGFVRRM